MTIEIIRSETEGRVLDAVVEVGDKVSADDPLILIEIMKMHIPVLAGKAGVVKSLLVSAGDNISEGQPVAELEV